jgi:hypothetical protein
MRNRVLYFPFIRVPNSAWFTQILLYWDDIATIVPYDYVCNPDLHDEYTRNLIRANLVTQVIPGIYLDNIELSNASFVEYLESLGPGLRARQRMFRNRNSPTKIHIEKMGNLGHELVDRGLATFVNPPWYDVERQTADDFMSYLSVVLGRASGLQFTPITDQLSWFKPANPI